MDKQDNSQNIKENVLFKRDQYLINFFKPEQYKQVKEKWTPISG